MPVLPIPEPVPAPLPVPPEPEPEPPAVPLPPAAPDATTGAPPPPPHDTKQEATAINAATVPRRDHTPSPDVSTPACEIRIFASSHERCDGQLRTTNGARRESRRVPQERSSPRASSDRWMRWSPLRMINRTLFAKAFAAIVSPPSAIRGNT
ncbi:protein of unknown function [Paraburkholderia dioscoreae]|uniref:Uncharacterized protein n=1 Tax=Paraburkholderia dioscoreae TaxID=2604047 RepID=A0A5Q4Z808_9BURK|nr:protein of unknown function [Paraburkholderia dioscoreae]